ncbi:MAG: DUF4442 domain-containing protein [Bowdeniella nasicola]|nr:DUF4442 domain-containing protein [Bowdeniella nasicola]
MRLPTYQDLDELFMKPALTRVAMNLWPPFLGSSIKILEITPDFRRVRVCLRHRALTANYLGTAYGASLFSLADPWWVMMLTRALGRGYSVWDRAAEIEFIRPGRTHVFAQFVLTDEELAAIREGTRDGEKHLRWFTNDLITADGEVIARVNKQVYVRRRPA